LVEIGFLDEGLWPNCFHQFFLADNYSGALNEFNQDFDCLGW
jgi:hypothetical protein